MTSLLKRHPFKRPGITSRPIKRPFDRVETDTGVGRELITAILLVETRLGGYIGSSSILNTLSTMAALNEPRILEAFWEKVPPGAKTDQAQV